MNNRFIDETAYNQLTAIEKAGYREEWQFYKSSSWISDSTAQSKFTSFEKYKEHMLPEYTTLRIYIPIEPGTVKEAKKICGQTCNCKTENDCHFEGLRSWVGASIPALPMTEGSPINDKGESKQSSKNIQQDMKVNTLDYYLYEYMGYKIPTPIQNASFVFAMKNNEHCTTCSDRDMANKVEIDAVSFQAGAEFGTEQYAQKVKAVIDPIFKKYQKYRDNLQWHIDTNFPVDKDEVEQRISEQDEVIKDLGTILTQLNNIK